MLKKTTIISIILIVLISFVLISYQSKGLLLFDKIHLYSLFYPIDYLQNFLNEILKTKDENRDLKEKLYEMHLQISSTNELIEENKRLKELLNLKERKKEILTIAKIIKRGANKFLKTVWIDKGKKDGVKVNMPVITINGLVGKVIFASEDFSEILLITDPNFSASVRVERNRIEGVLSGSGTNLCLLKYIPLEEEIMVGDRLITSGTDGIFPEGLSVGVVRKVDRKRGVFQNIEVVPLQSELKIEEVAILKSLP